MAGEDGKQADRKVDQRLAGNVFRWQEGEMAAWHHISQEMCFKAGNILGRKIDISRNIWYFAGMHDILQFCGICKRQNHRNRIWKQEENLL